MRTEIPAKVRVAAFERCGKRCERCTAPLMAGKFAYDHRIPDALGGSATLDNVQVLCTACHGQKTAREDIPVIAKTKRIRSREAGIKRPRSIRSWRRFDGTIVTAPRER